MDLWGVLARTLGAAWQLWVDAILLRPDVDRLLNEPSWGPVLVIAAAAGAAGMIGQSVVLSINRIRGFAQLFSLLASALLLMGSGLIEGLVLWTVGQVAVGGHLHPFAVARMLLISTAPLVFEFLTAIPLLGPGIDLALSGWSFLVTWAAVASAYGLGFWGSGLLTGVAWLVTLGLYALLSPLFARLRDSLWRRLTGRALHADSTYLLDLVDVFDDKPAPGLNPPTDEQPT